MALVAGNTSTSRNSLQTSDIKDLMASKQVRSKIVPVSVSHLKVVFRISKDKLCLADVYRWLIQRRSITHSLSALGWLYLEAHSSIFTSGILYN